MSRIAIQADKLKLAEDVYQSYSEKWVKKAQELGHEIILVDLKSQEIIDTLKGVNGLMWRFSVSADERSLYARILFAAEKFLNIKVFPDWNTSWHYDDKIAQIYAFKAVNISVPDTWIFWNKKEAIDFVEKASFPLVIKLAGGASSTNVSIIDHVDAAKEWIDLLFGSGVFHLKKPEKLSFSNLRPRLRNSLKLLLKDQLPNPGKYWHLNKNYIFLQEFLPDNAFDIRITIIGKRAFGFRRFNRPNDFRASGSGSLDNDPAKIDMEAVKLGFDVAQKLKMQSVGVDLLKKEDKYVVNEVSYTFAAWAVHACPGHWILCGNDPFEDEIIWQAGQLHPADAIMEDFLKQIDKQ